jgi:hypothetical protein
MINIRHHLIKKELSKLKMSLRYLEVLLNADITSCCVFSEKVDRCFS